MLRVLFLAPLLFFMSLHGEGYLTADYLLWKIRNSPQPVPLVVSQEVSGGPFTGTLLGGKDIVNDWRSGARVTLGYWFDTLSCFGAEANYFFLGCDCKRFGVGPATERIKRLRIPFFDVNLNKETSIALSTLNRFTGRGYITLNNWMQGAELNLLNRTFFSNGSMSLQPLLGFRYWNYRENFNFIVRSGLSAVPSFFNTFDSFKVDNHFFGGQLGVSFDYYYCSFFFNVKGKVALGAMSQRNLIRGCFSTDEVSDTATGPIQSYPEGIFALFTNIGTHCKTRFSVLPELEVNLGYEVTQCFRLRVGYSALYVTEVLFASHQVDPHLNTTQSVVFKFPGSQPNFTGPIAPQARMTSDDLWVHGLNVGFELTF